MTVFLALLLWDDDTACVYGLYATRAQAERATACLPPVLRVAIEEWPVEGLPAEPSSCPLPLDPGCLVCGEAASVTILPPHQPPGAGLCPRHAELARRLGCVTPLGVVREGAEGR